MAGSGLKIGVAQTVYLSSGATLSDINVAIDQWEGVGLLVVMTNGKDEKQVLSTILIFDLSKEEPTKHAKAQPSSQPPPSNASVVCSGRVYIAGQLTECTAYRPN